MIRGNFAVYEIYVCFILTIYVLMTGLCYEQIFLAITSTMRPNAVVLAFGQYLTTTTLHGFKYLYSPYIADRIAWLVSCTASATCAGVLCGVLWSRFRSVPNLLSLRSANTHVDMPKLGLCLPPSALAKRVVIQQFGANYSDLAIPLGKALLGHQSSEYQLAHVDFLLKTHNLTLATALQRNTPDCAGVVMKCRVGGVMVDCGRMVREELTPNGVCCVVDVVRLKQNPKDEPERTLELVMETPSQNYTFYDLYAWHEGKGWQLVTTLTPRHFYTGYLWFHYILGSETERPAGDRSCNEDPAYSRVSCLRACAEWACGCSEPLVNRTLLGNVCSITRLACLRNTYSSDKCNNACLPSCEQVTTFISLEYVVMDALKYEIDPLYKDLDASKAVVLSISLRTSGSQIFVRMPTETWLTLLSSLGGVFNMFLGVGLFSGLEFIYFLFVRLPIAIKNRGKSK